MNHKRAIIVSLVLFQMINLFSQTVEFTYDNNGNRLTRTIQTEQLRSNTVKFPVKNPKSLKVLEAQAKGVEAGTTSKAGEAKVAEDVTRERIKQEDGEMVTLVYPNPNKGLIKIDISNMPLNSVNEMRLYDLSGAELIIKRNFGSNSEMDISRFKDGIYVLRIKINERIFDWKVVKSHN